MRPMLIAAGAAVLALASCAPTATPGVAGARQCFFASQANTFQADDARTVFVTVGARDVYRLDLAGPCPDVDWTQQLAIRPRGGGSVCAGFDAELIVPQAAGSTYRCQIRTVTKLTEEEVEARRARR